jgi:hypothetical protein
MVIAKIQTPTQSFRPLAAIVDDAESVGEGDEGLKRSIGYRAKSFASTEVLRDGFEKQSIGFWISKRPQWAGWRRQACGSQFALRSDRVEIRLSLIVYCRPR